MSRQNSVFKPRGKTFNLILNMCCKVNSRTIGDMAIGPPRMFTFWGSAFIKLTRLGKQNKWLVYYLASMGIKLIPPYFIIGITEVHRCRLLTVPIFKGCRIRKSPINRSEERRVGKEGGARWWHGRV